MAMVMAMVMVMLIITIIIISSIILLLELQINRVIIAINAIKFFSRLTRLNFIIA